ncbi:MAG: hypothetical protein PV344_05200, partial [Anaplasma sp.]|nr:hypothetical protein [Anaplasma sp.]
MYLDTFEYNICASVVKYIYGVSIVSRYFAMFWYLVTFVVENKVPCLKSISARGHSIFKPKSRD